MSLKIEGSGKELFSIPKIGKQTHNKEAIVQKEESGVEKKLIRDEYIRSKENKAIQTGLYQVIKSEDGKKIVYDRIEKEKTERKALSRSESEDAKSLRSAKEKKEMGHVDTGSVDREIEMLKKKRDVLLKQISSFGGEDSSGKIQSLQRQLEQVEQELIQKDNEGYRKQHASSSKGRGIE